MQKNDTRTGVVNAVSAYLIWGIAPIYFKLIQHVSPDEIMVHRVLWSSVFLAIIVFLSHKWRTLSYVFTTPQILLKLSITASFLAVNWFLFIWAVNNDHLLDASLGYFISPLFSIALGVIFLDERLSKWQLTAVFLAVAGVLIQLIALGSLPIISLAIAGSFGLYGLLRKKLELDSFVALLIESLIMLPIALIYWLIFVESTSSNLFHNHIELNLMLMFAGIVTIVPLLCFTAAAKRLKLSTIGFFQYIGPIIMFIMATFYYHEPLAMAKLLTFGCIWLALFIYSVDVIKTHQG